MFLLFMAKRSADACRSVWTAPPNVGRGLTEKGRTLRIVTSLPVEPVELGELGELGDLSDLRDGQIRVFRTLGEHGVVVCRVSGELHAVDDNCSHREAKLSEGRLRGALLTCPLHGAQFDVRTGAHQGPPASTPIACHAVTESGGRAVLVLNEAKNNEAKNTDASAASSLGENPA